MKKIFLLLTISMITACGFGGSSGDSSGGGSGSVNQANLYLGTDFTISSFHGQKFKNDRNTLNYSVDKVDPAGQNADDIARDLENAIITKHGASNFTSYHLGSHKIIGNIVDNKMLIITFPVETFDRNNSSNKISGTYSFTINFDGKNTSAVLDFYLGDGFAIESLDGKPFTSHSPTTYEVDNIDSTDIKPNQILFDLRIAIEAKLDENSNITYELGGASGGGNIAPNGKYLFEFPITIKEKNNSNNIISGTYSFTVNFNGDTTHGKLSFYLGNDFTIENIGNQPFTNINNPLIYTADNVDRKYKDSNVITAQLKTAINEVLGSNSSITYTLGDNALDVSDNQIKVKFNIIITAKDNANNINGIYSFTINFREGGTPPTPVDLSFYLGETFSISSINNQPFTTNDSQSLIYYVNNVDRKNQTDNIIKNQLDAEIKKVLNRNNEIKYDLGNSTAINKNNSLKVTFPIEITALNDVNNSKSGEYVFNIVFIETPPPLALSFYLGRNFTIESIFSKYFTTDDDQSLIYNIDEIVKGTIDNNTVETELKTAIKKELDKNIDITYILDSSSKNIDDQQIVVQIPITITKKNNSKSSINGTYIFTITYETVSSIELDFDLGENFTIPSLDGENFITNDQNPLLYTIDNIYPAGKDSTNIREEIENGIKAVLDSKSNVTYDIVGSGVSGHVGAGREITIEYTVRLTQKDKPSNTMTKKYDFTINFNNETIPKPKPDTPDFDLGDNFTISSIGRNKFISSDDLSLIYTADNITIIQGLSLYDIHNQLQRAIRKQLDKNSNLGYTLGKYTLDVIGKVEYGGELTVKYEIEITELVNPSNKINGVYSFTMKFKEYVAPFEPSFYLGDRFTVDSLNGEVFTPVNGDEQYRAYRTVAGGKDATVLENELLSAIGVVHSKNDKINHTLGDPTTTGKIAPRSRLTIKIPATLTDRTNSDNSSTGTYIFEFPFIDDAWNGTATTEPRISADNYYLVDHANDLAWLVEQTSIDKNIRVIADINMDNKSFTGIKEFKGIFDGDNHSIKKLKIVSGTNTTALIQKITGDSTIKNIVLDIGTINGTEYTSGLIGTAIGTATDKLQLEISNSTTNLNIFAGSENAEHEIRLGGFLAYAKDVDLTVIKLANNGKIDSSYGSYCYVGGIIGQVDSDDGSGTLTIIDSKTTQRIEAIRCRDKNYVGGIIGSNYTRKTDIRNTSNAKLTHTSTNTSDEPSDPLDAYHTYLGGIMGYNKNSMPSNPDDDNGITITSSYNIGAVTNFGKHTSSVGGFIGENISPKITITNSYNMGELFSSSERFSYSHVGGLVGVNKSHKTTLISTFNSGGTSFASLSEDSPNATAGGLIARNSPPFNDKTHHEVTITNSYNRGVIEGNNVTGGLIGYNIADNTSITTSSNRGSIENKKWSSGGIIGINVSDISITDTYNIGYVSGNKYIGGLIGESQSNHIEVKTSYNTGSITDNKLSKEHGRSGGGIIGYVNLLDNDTASPNTLTVEQTHNKGHVSVERYYGVGAQILGSIKGDAINTYKLNYYSTSNPHTPIDPIEPWDYSGNPIYDGFYDESSLFRGWDFINIWDIKDDNNHGHPVLRINKEL